MARVWFVRRQGGQWVAPGGAPAFELPLTAVIFPLDLGVHRLVSHERPIPAADLPTEDPAQLQRVFVEVEPQDLDGLIFTGYEPGIYDSPYSPRESARRLSALRPAARPAA
ncbi:MAG: hypothetical protein ABI629_07090 [bacterium]